MGKHLKLSFADWEETFDPNAVVTNHEGVDSKKNFNDDGVFSERIFGKVDDDGIQYCCSCGNLRGRFFEGANCSDCNTEVKFTKPVIKKEAWIDFGEFFLIKPLFYKMMDGPIFPKGSLAAILSYDVKLDLDGNIDEEETEGIIKFDYSNTGIVGFKNNFHEIIDHYWKISNSKNKDSVYYFVKENADKVFSSKMPVFTTVLRPSLMVNGKLVFDDINNYYNEIIYNIQSLKNYSDIEKKDINLLPVLFNTQLAWVKVYESINQSIKGKKGFIRNNILGTRVDYSSRNVITPLPPGYDINNIVLPYKTCIELFKPMIINILVQTKGINHNKATSIWFLARTKFNETIYQIIVDIINKTKGGCKVLFNRNPTISYGSILLLTVVGVKHDITDLTASIHNCILGLLSGDYDGDTLNIILLNDQRFKEVYSIFDPSSMFVSSQDGRFNNTLNIVRDQVLGVASFNM